VKIAIVHDELVRKGGAEQVVLSFHKAFPFAPIYTLSYNPDKTYPEFKSCNIKTSWFGKFVKDEDNLKRFFFPFAVWAMQKIHLKGYDVVLQSTTHCAKYVKVDPGALVVTYCHTPFRLAWRADSYEEVVQSKFFKRKLYEVVISMLRKIDKKHAQRTDWFIANAREVVPRILFAYHPKHKVTVINPPVKCRNFYISEAHEDYYLVVSRFEPYKKVDLVIDVFNQLPDKKLVIVGKGSMEDELKKKAGQNITFLSGLSASHLAEVYSKCKAFIFPQLEDYGITPLEANASGRPVIAYGKGGVLDTMIPVTGHNSKRATAIFFDDQTIPSLKKAILNFEHHEFDPVFIRQHAETFDEYHFVEKIQDFIYEKTKKVDETAPVLLNRHIPFIFFIYFSTGSL
jgi:glycosyltransferase involved in cell wall biosynthesis